MQDLEAGDPLVVHGHALGAEHGAEVDVDAGEPGEGLGLVAELDVREGVGRSIGGYQSIGGHHRGLDGQLDTEDDLPLEVLAVLLEFVEAVGVDGEGLQAGVQSEPGAIVPLAGLHGVDPARVGSGEEGEEVVVLAGGRVDAEHAVEVHDRGGQVHQPHAGPLLVVGQGPRDEGAGNHQAEGPAAGRDIDQPAGGRDRRAVGVAEEHVGRHPHLVDGGAATVRVGGGDVAEPRPPVGALLVVLLGAQEGADLAQVGALLAVAKEVGGAGGAVLGGEGLAVLSHDFLGLQAVGEAAHEVVEGGEGHGEHLDLLDGDRVTLALGPPAGVARLQVQPDHRQGWDDVDVGGEHLQDLVRLLLLARLFALVGEGLQVGGEAEGAALAHQSLHVLPDVALVLHARGLFKGEDHQLPRVVLPDPDLAEQPRPRGHLAVDQGRPTPSGAHRHHHGEGARDVLHLLARVLEAAPHLLNHQVLPAENGLQRHGHDARQVLGPRLGVRQREALRPEVARVQEVAAGQQLLVHGRGGGLVVGRLVLPLACLHGV
eukprot:757206-Hanusia_phi.AAC.1